MERADGGVLEFKEALVPDHLPRRKDIDLFATIVPHSAEITKL